MDAIKRLFIEYDSTKNSIYIKKVPNLCLHNAKHLVICIK